MSEAVPRHAIMVLGDTQMSSNRDRRTGSEAPDRHRHVGDGLTHVGEEAYGFSRVGVCHSGRPRKRRLPRCPSWRGPGGPFPLCPGPCAGEHRHSVSIHLNDGVDERASLPQRRRTPRSATGGDSADAVGYQVLDHAGGLLQIDRVGRLPPSAPSLQGVGIMAQTPRTSWASACWPPHALARGFARQFNAGQRYDAAHELPSSGVAGHKRGGASNDLRLAQHCDAFGRVAELFQNFIVC